MSVLQTAEQSMGTPQPRYQAHRIENIHVIAHATADTVRSLLTPIAKNSATGKYEVYANGGANDTDKMVGFTAHEVTWTQFTGQVNPVTMLVEGEIQYDDIPKLGVDPADFLADLLASGLREKNIHIKGVDGFYA